MAMLQIAIRQPAVGFVLAGVAVALILVDALLGTNSSRAVYDIVPDPAGGMPF
jgi:hypothetical protein